MSNADDRPSPRPRIRMRSEQKAGSRFGPTAIVREGPTSEDPQLLSLFARGQDRRSSTRFAATEQRAWLGWWAQAGEFSILAARLENISQGGALLAMANPPPPHQIVWLCLGVPDPRECVEAKVLEVVTPPGRDATIRIAFGTPCPENFYRTAIHGLAPQNRDEAE